LAPAASKEIAFLKTDKPLAYLSDCTFRLIQDYYPRTSQLSPQTRRECDECESRAIAAADLLIYSSDWAAESAIRDYGASAEKVHVIPFGPNLKRIPDSATVTSPRNREECRLLLLGKDWKRKGGPLVFDTMRLLNEQGLPTRLTVCGTALPEEIHHPKLEVTGFLDKNTPAGLDTLEKLLTESHFLFVPSRAEAFGIVFCEASAYGLPSIATATGGITTIVKNGVNGYLLPLHASAEDFAELIQTLFSDAERYQQLVESSRQRYDETLNWNAWANRVRELLRYQLTAQGPASQ